MGVLRRIKDWWGGQFGTPGAETWAPSIAWSLGQDSGRESGGSDDVADSYREHPVIATAVSQFCEDAASVMWQMYKVDQRSGKVAEDPIEGHPLLRALNRPNALQHGAALWVASYLDVFLHGEFFWYYPEFGFGEVNGPVTSARFGKRGELVMLPPKRVEVEIRDGELAYFFVKQAGNRQPLDAAFLTHHKRTNPYNPLRGLSVLESIETEICSDMAASEWNEHFFSGQNGVKTMVVKTALGANMTAEQRADWVRRWNVEGSKAKRGVGLLPPGWDVADVGTAQRDMDFRALRDYSRELMLGAIGVPPFQAGVLDKANYANSRQQKDVYWSAIRRFLNPIRDTLNYDFLPKVGVSGLEMWPDWESCTELIEDFQEKLNAAKSMLEIGVPLDQANERLDLGIDVSKCPGANDAFLGAGLKSLDQVLNPPEPPDPFGGSAKPLGQNAPSPSKTFKSLAGATREKRVAHWKTHQHRTADLEKRFETVIRGHFNRLRSEVMDNVDGLKGVLARHKALNDDWFDMRRANKNIRDKTKPLDREAIKRGGEQLVAEIEASISFDLESPAVVALLAELQGKIVGINETVEKALRERLAEVLDQKGTIDDLRDAVREVFDSSLGRARTIARTEMGAAYNGARIEGMVQAGIEKIEWLSSEDEDVRETHRIDGETVVLGEAFSNGCRWPNDPAAPPEEVINCRCVPLAVVNLEGE